MKPENDKILNKIIEDAEKRIQSKLDGKTLSSNDLEEMNSAILSLAEMLRQHNKELDLIDAQGGLKLEKETEFDRYQLDLLDFIFSKGSINDAQLEEFCKKDTKYRVAFTKLKDVYIYKGFGSIYSDAVKYHIKPEKEKYIAEQLEKTE